MSPQFPMRSPRTMHSNALSRVAWQRDVIQVVRLASKEDAPFSDGEHSLLNPVVVMGTHRFDSSTGA